VILDGRPAAPGTRVRSGMNVRVLFREEGEKNPCPESLCETLRVVAREEGLAAVAKPAGIHSARGRSGESVEDCLPFLFPGLEPVLLNRLDAMTSGLVLAALSREAEERYLTAQEQGAVRKIYLALVRGELAEEMSVTNRIDSAKRRRVRFLPDENPDVRRHTLVFPIRVLAGRTLVRAEIVKGQRHQIRAHLAGTGFPIVGDPLYGSGEGDTMFLHHSRIELAGFAAECVPAWLGPDGMSVLFDVEK
jgi:23S rRNA pseudouridine1911/1915/1917 synthase